MVSYSFPDVAQVIYKSLLIHNRDQDDIIVGWARYCAHAELNTSWAERVLLGIYPLTATAYSLRVQQRAHPA
jgi:hypothetical protein